MSPTLIANDKNFLASLPSLERRAFDRIRDSAVEIVLFGSRAASLHSNKSDWDLLAVSTEKPTETGRLDIVFRTPDEVFERKWLGSELASHIARYGILMSGSADWVKSVRLDEEAVGKKRQRLIARVDGLWNYWSRLHPEFRQKYLKTIRREVQRLQLLIDHVPVPPTALLDQKWSEDPVEKDNWRTFIEKLELGNEKMNERMLLAANLIVTSRPAIDQTQNSLAR